VAEADKAEEATDLEAEWGAVKEATTEAEFVVAGATGWVETGAV
jgi:hypothetical protein